MGIDRNEQYIPLLNLFMFQVYTLQSLLRAKIRELKERHKKIAEHVEESETRSLKKLGMDNKEEVDAFLAKYDTLEAVDVMHHLNNFSQMLDSYDEAPRKRVKREPGRGRKPATKKKVPSSFLK